jgi:hypothetical protein
VVSTCMRRQQSVHELSCGEMEGGAVVSTCMRRQQSVHERSGACSSGCCGCGCVGCCAARYGSKRRSSGNSGLGSTERMVGVSASTKLRREAIQCIAISGQPEAIKS